MTTASLLEHPGGQIQRYQSPRASFEQGQEVAGAGADLDHRLVWCDARERHDVHLVEAAGGSLCEPGGGAFELFLYEAMVFVGHGINHARRLSLPWGLR